MKTSWRREQVVLFADDLNPGERIQYDRPWLQEASPSVNRSITPVIPDFTKHSPLGSGEWYVPWNARWNVLGESMV